jgi:hypothetical protein
MYITSLFYESVAFMYLYFSSVNSVSLNFRLLLACVFETPCDSWQVCSAFRIKNNVNNDVRATDWLYSRVATKTIASDLNLITCRFTLPNTSIDVMLCDACNYILLYLGCKQ